MTHHDRWHAGDSALWIGTTHQRLGESKCRCLVPSTPNSMTIARGALCLGVSPRSRLALAVSSAAILTVDSGRRRCEAGRGKPATHDKSTLLWCRMAMSRHCVWQEIANKAHASARELGLFGEICRGHAKQARRMHPFASLGDLAFRLSPLTCEKPALAIFRFVLRI